MENKHKTFKPFDRVLVREIDDHWTCDFYSHYNPNSGFHETLVVRRVEDENILPYEGNESLLGTTDEPEAIELKEGDKIICSNKIERLNKGKGSLEDFFGVEDICFMVKNDFGGGFLYAIRFSDFNPDDMEETKKHILCVKNGKIFRYKS